MTIPFCNFTHVWFDSLCAGGGPGRGAGGVVGMPGENCVPQGNILIIQESNKETPDDNFAGGVLCFDFVSPLHVISIGLMDIPQRRGDFIEVDVDGASAPIRVNFAGLGNNAVQTVPINVFDARRLCLYLLGEGAVTDLAICADRSNAPSLSTYPSVTPSIVPTSSFLPSAQPSSVPTGSISPSLGPSATPSTTLVPSIAANSIASVSPSSFSCTPVKIDFELEGSKKRITPGAFVGVEKFDQFGLTISTNATKSREVTFMFDTPVERTISIDLVNIDDNTSFIEVESGDSSDPIKLDVIGTGGMSVKTVLLPFTQVRKITMNLSGSGAAVTALRCCLKNGFQIQAAPPAPPNVSSQCSKEKVPCAADPSKIQVCHYKDKENAWSDLCIEESEWEDVKKVWAVYCGHCQAKSLNPHSFRPKEVGRMAEVSEQCSAGKFGVDNIEVLSSDGEQVHFTMKHKLASVIEKTQIWFDNIGKEGGSLCFEKANVACDTEMGQYTAKCTAGWATVHIVGENGNNFKQEGDIEEVSTPNCQDGFDFVDFNPMKRCHWQIKIPCAYSRPARNLAATDSKGLPQLASAHQSSGSSGSDKIQRDCELKSKAVDVLSVGVDSCTQNGFERPVQLISQDKETVTFALWQVWKGCSPNSDSSTLGWIAVDYIGLDDHLQCSKFESLNCGFATTLSAKCSDGASVVDLYTYDTDAHMFQQTDGSAVAVPTACDTSGDARKICHFRYILKCEPSQCMNSRPAVRRLGSALSVE